MSRAELIDRLHNGVASELTLIARAARENDDQAITDAARRALDELQAVINTLRD